MVFFFRHFVYTIGISKVGLNVSLLELSIALILIALYKNTYKLNRLKVLSWYGRNSYEVYLAHMLLITGIAWSSLPLWVAYPIGIVGSGVLGAFVAKYYSEPLNRKIRNVSSGL
jgi:peptidoglycan/LPS O-acetylase OafA/YrhL